MDYQILVNIILGIMSLTGGWVFKLILGHVEEMKKNHSDLVSKQNEDIKDMVNKHNGLALTLPEKYVIKDDFRLFSERMNDRFDRLEQKIDNLNK